MVTTGRGRAAGMPEPRTVERRAHARRRLGLEAQLATESGARGTCRVRDFSDGGMLLGWSEPGPSSGEQGWGAVPFSPSQRLQLRFAASIDGRPRPFALRLRVARCLGSGLGVAFEQPDPEALRVLHRLADAEQAPGAGPVDPPSAAARGLRERAERLLAELLPAFLQRAERRLLQAANESRAPQDQAPALALMRALREQGPALAQAFAGRLLNALSEGFGAGSEAGRWVPMAAGGATGGLQLVDKHEFEQLLVASDLVERLERTHRSVLAEFGRRLTTLARAEGRGAGSPADTLPGEAHPLAPAGWFGALGEVFGPLAPQPVQRAQLYRSLEEELSPRLTAFYEELNAFLEKAGVTPAKLATVTAPAPRPAPAARRNPDTEGSGPRASPDAAAALAAARTLLLLKRDGVGREPWAEPAVDSPADAPATREALVDALSALQRSAAGTTAAALREQLAARPGGRSTPEDDVLEVTGQLLAAVLDDPALSSLARGAIDRLSVPLHKLALLEPDCLAQSTHPARQLLDQLALLQPSASAEEAAALDAEVARLVNRVLGQYDRDGEVFERSLAALGELVEAQAAAFERGVAEVVARCEAQQATLLARRRGSDTLPLERPVAEEWRQWLARARRLQVGDKVVFAPGTAQARQATLAWVGVDFNPFVFVDARGARSASLSLQEVAMQLRRGSLVLREDAGRPAVERALYGMLQRVQRGGASASVPPPAVEPVSGSALEQQARQLLEGGRLVLRRQPLAALGPAEGGGLYELRLGSPQADLPPALLGRVLVQPARALAVALALVDAAFGWLAREQAEGLHLLPLPGAALAEPRLLEAVTARLLEGEVAPGRLCFLLDDPAMLDPLSEAAAFARGVTEFGCRLALEGFGGGGLSCDRLSGLPAEFVVLEAGQTALPEGDAAAGAGLRSLTELARFMGLRSIARGVEHAGSLERLGGLGVDFALGGAAGAPQWLDEVSVAGPGETA